MFVKYSHAFTHVIHDDGKGEERSLQDVTHITLQGFLQIYVYTEKTMCLDSLRLSLDVPRHSPGVALLCDVGVG